MDNSWPDQLLMRRGLLPSILLLAAPLLLANTTADPIFDKRYGSFMEAGYDPLTVPPEWFEPTEPVKGGNAAWLPVVEAVDRTIATTALEAAALYAKEQKSTALIVIQGGKVQFERYWRDDGPDSIFNPQSMSKTIVGMMVGTAIADGKIHSVSDRVERYVPEWRGQPRGQITIENLLNMASGLEQIEGKFGYSVSIENPAVKQSFGSDFYGPVLEMQSVEAPNKTFDYNNNDANLLGIILQRATGQRYADYLSEKLWKPLGLRDAHLYLDREGGAPIVSCCIFSRPRDWAKIGQLFLQNGKWNDDEIIAPSWLSAMTSPSPVYSGYGYQIWLGDKETEDFDPGSQSESYAASDLIILRGYGFQRVWISPSHDLVIVRAGKSWPPSFDEAMIPNTIIRGLKMAKQR